MGHFEIIKRTGGRISLMSKDPFRAIKSAVQETSLMGDDIVKMTIVSSDILTFDKGDKIVIDGYEYVVRTAASREMLSDRHFQYDVTFYGVMYELMKSLYRDTDASGKSSKNTFDLTYSIKDFIKVLIYNVNRDYPGLWRFDESNCPDTEPRTIQFSKQNCLQALQTICSEQQFHLNFKITQSGGVRTIHIGKFGQIIAPPSGSAFFEWGKGAGLYGLKEEKIDDKAVITRLWVEGGSTNIRSDYREYSERLQLPYPRRLNKNEHTLSDGTVVSAGSEVIGIYEEEKRYIEDAFLAATIGTDEDAEFFDDIFPRRTGTVTATVDGDICAFIDSSMDFDLCEKDENGTKYLIDGVSAKITFISGKLSGQQFELSEKEGYVHSQKKFKILPFTDKRGLTIPTKDSEAYRIVTGDKYKITDINLPRSYEEDAEEELWYAGMDAFKPRTQARAQYQLVLDRLYFLENSPVDSDTRYFNVGDYVPVKDARFGIEKNIRIQKVVRNLMIRHDYSLTLSDIAAVSIQMQSFLDVASHNQIIQNNNLKDLNKARRGWRTVEELRTMVYDTDGYFDIDNIRPNSIDTNMLTVGSKSQQFILVDVVLEANVNGNPNKFSASGGTLAHLTIDEDAVHRWSMSAADISLTSSKGYYLFAKCSKSGRNGVWHLTQEQLMFEPASDPNNYYFQVGILGSLHADDNFRDFVTTYGFTRINGNTITTGKIVTSDGECYLDLDGNKFRIGDAASSVDWNVTAQNQLTLRNVMLMSGSGDTAPIGVYRGVYNSGYIYYRGDEVSYTNGGQTCTYRYIYPEPSKGNAPTNAVYWSVVAQGAQGEAGLPGTDASSGDYYEYRYAKNGSTTTPPTLDPSSENPPGWSTQMPSVGPLEYVWCIIGRRSGMMQKTSFYYPFKITDNPVINDASGNGVHGQLGTGEVVYSNTPGAVGTNFVLRLIGNQWSRAPFDPPFGRSFTMCFWLKSSWSSISWILNGKEGKEQVEDSMRIEPMTWFHFAARFGESSVVIFVNGSQHGSYTLSSSVSGFAVFDHNMFGSTVWFDEVRLLDYGLPESDIKKLYNGEADTLTQSWSTPIRITPYDGQDGQQGESPALVYRGEYSSLAVYYGNRYRVDAVKYGSKYYVARIDAGSFSNVTPSLFSTKWNAFGAQFESIATGLLLAENANIAGWVFRNNRLESQSGKVYMDGVNGTVRLAGTMQLSTGFSGNISDVNIFYIPKQTSIRRLTMGYEKTDIGKVCRFFNNSNRGSNGIVILELTRFGVKTGSAGSSTVVYSSQEFWIRPKEIVEVTCFEFPRSEVNSTDPSEVCGQWVLTGRFGDTEYRSEGSKGRYPILIAIGRITGTETGVSIDGKLFDGRSVSSVFSVRRQGMGNYRVYSNGISLPPGYKVMLTGYGRDLMKGTVDSYSPSGFRVHVSDDSTPNDGSVEFFIFAPDWEYNLI